MDEVPNIVQEVYKGPKPSPIKRNATRQSGCLRRPFKQLRKEEKLIFVYGVRKCSSFFLLQVVDQFSQHHLLKRSSFSIVYFSSFVEDKVSICTWVYLRAFYSVPLIYISVFVLVPYCLDDSGFVVEPEVRQVDSSSSILLSQDYFGYSRFFCISIQIVKLFVLVL